MEINSLKILEEHFGNNFNKKEKKKLKKLFSIAMNNRFDVTIEDDFMYFNYDGDYITATSKVSLKNIENAKEYISMNDIIFKESGYKLNIRGEKYLALMFDDYSMVYGRVRNFRNINNFCIQKKSSNVISAATNTSTFYSQMIRMKEYFRELSFDEIGKYGHSLCIKDIGGFKRGTIVDRNGYSIYPSTTSPKTTINNLGLYGASLDRYECNLSLTTLDELKNLQLNTESCSKQEFGCRKGCVSHCYSDAYNKRATKLKQDYIKLWKELFE